MKKIANIIIVALLALVSVACEKEGGNVELSPTHKSMVGSWHLIEWAGPTADTESLLNIDVWINFYANGTFDIYQKGMPYIYYTKFSGSCSVNGEVLSGTYSDGKPLGSDYNVELSEDGELLTLTKTDMAADIAKYERVDSVPSEILSGVRSSVVRSEECNIERFL